MLSLTLKVGRDIHLHEEGGYSSYWFYLVIFCAGVAGDFKSKCAGKITNFLPLMTTTVVVIMTLLSKTQTRSCLWFCEKWRLVTPRCCYAKRNVCKHSGKGFPLLIKCKRGGWDCTESVSELLCCLANERSFDQFAMSVFLNSHCLVEKLSKF